MKRKRMNLSWEPCSEVIRNPAFPSAGFRLFDELRAALSLGYSGKLLSLEQLAFLLQIPLSTSHDWFRTAPLAQVQALLCILERLPAEGWLPILRHYLRTLPALEHPRLAHDNEGIIMLEGLLLQETGLTLIQGGTSADRSFVLTALGHSFHRVDPLHRNVRGLDVREPRDFVPVAGVTYFKNSLTSERLRQLLLHHWREEASSKAPVLLVNGLVCRIPEILPTILKAASTRHIIMADDQRLSPEQLTHFSPDSTRILTLSKTMRQPWCIYVTLRQF